MDERPLGDVDIDAIEAYLHGIFYTSSDEYEAWEKACDALMNIQEKISQNIECKNAS